MGCFLLLHLQDSCAPLLRLCSLVEWTRKVGAHSSPSERCSVCTVTESTTGHTTPRQCGVRFHAVRRGATGTERFTDRRKQTQQTAPGETRAHGNLRRQRRQEFYGGGFVAGDSRSQDI
ncbi:hypothetical protein LDENG_00253700 [Lucifuga dentata]|nr:hypothetical protein LDENG_00253700 [Lucifuga dentata]